MTTPIPAEQIALVGCGAVGSAVVRAVGESPHRVSAIVTRRPETARALADRYDIPLSDTPASIQQDVTCIIIAVPDDEIRSVADRLASASLRLRDVVVVHTSGARNSDDLDSLRLAGALVASAHPLQTFLRGDTAAEQFRSVYVSLEGMPPATGRIARVFQSMGALPFRISQEEKIEMHAAASIMSNFLVTLADLVTGLIEKSVGVAPPLKVLVPLIRKTLDNLEHLPPGEALTGPIARGDIGTVRTHLDALSKLPATHAIYRALALQTVELALRAHRISEAHAEEFRCVIHAG